MSKETRKFIQVLMGPRQVGKTTMVRQMLEQTDIPYMFESADAIPASGTVWLMQVWEAARLRLKQSGHKEFLLVIDEVQKVANWSESIPHASARREMNRLKRYFKSHQNGAE